MLFQPLMDLFFPQVCMACGKGLSVSEECLCLNCRKTLPVTNFHKSEQNPVFNKFKGRLSLKQATSFLFFTKEGYTQQLIHQLKYHGKRKIGIYLGTEFAKTLNQNGWLQGVDCILPVPLHRKRQKMRGYNQATVIAKGLSAGSRALLGYADILLKVKNTVSQTRKTGLERLNNVRDAFKLKRPEAVRGKNILLVDDVLTTGATLESCALELLKGAPESISIATLAVASNI